LKVAGQTNARLSEKRTMYSTSRLRKSGPIWLAMAPMRSQAKNTYANSTQFGSWMVMTSPGPRPRLCSAAAVRSTRASSSP
jgi:hypothetical protein